MNLGFRPIEIRKNYYIDQLLITIKLMKKENEI